IQIFNSNLRCNRAYQHVEVLKPWRLLSAQFHQDCERAFRQRCFGSEHAATLQEFVGWNRQFILQRTAVNAGPSAVSADPECGGNFPPHYPSKSKAWTSTSPSARWHVWSSDWRCRS